MRIAVRASVVTLGLFVVLFWLAFGAKSVGQDRLTAVMLSRPSPLVMSGMHLRLDRGLEPPLQLLSPSARYVAIVTSDECSVCRSQVGEWETALARVPFQSGDGVIVLSIAGQEIPQRLVAAAKQLGVTIQVANITDVTTFQQETGIAWTPQIAALDGELRVRHLPRRVDGVGFQDLITFFEAASSN